MNERDGWYALDEYDLAICPHCGLLRAICSDPDVPWYPQRDVCWATASRLAVDRKWRAKYEKAKPDAVYHTLPTDGVTVWVSPHDLSPDDRFLD